MITMGMITETSEPPRLPENPPMFWILRILDSPKETPAQESAMARFLGVFGLGFGYIMYEVRSSSADASGNFRNSIGLDRFLFGGGLLDMQHQFCISALYLTDWV